MSGMTWRYRGRFLRQRFLARAAAHQIDEDLADPWWLYPAGYCNGCDWCAPSEFENRRGYAPPDPLRVPLMLMAAALSAS